MKRIEGAWFGDVRAGSVVDAERAGSIGISLAGIIFLILFGRSEMDSVERDKVVG